MFYLRKETDLVSGNIRPLAKVFLPQRAHVCLRLSAGREKEFFSKLSVNSVAEKVSLMQDVYSI